MYLIFNVLPPPPFLNFIFMASLLNSMSTVIGLYFNFLTIFCCFLFLHLELLYRKEAFTCWPQNTGAEEFNYGSRIDHILCAGSCLHQEHDLQGHSFMNCHVMECDILTQYRRWKPGNTLRYWHDARRL